MSDIKMRRTWSLSTGKMIDETDVENTPDKELNKPLSKTDNIRVELTLKNALTLFEKRGPDVAEIFS